MPMGKGKRPVGRPRKIKNKNNLEGEVFPTNYGTLRLDFAKLDSGSCDMFKDFDSAYEKIISDLWLTKKRADESIQRLEEDKKASETLRSELMECSLMSELLKGIFEWELREALKTDDFRHVRSIAVAYTVGMLTVISHHREYERTYATKRKVAQSGKAGAELIRLERPTKSELTKALTTELSKQGGSRTKTVNEVAKRQGVSSRTLRNWINEMSIEY